VPTLAALEYTEETGVSAAIAASVSNAAAIAVGPGTLPCSRYSSLVHAGRSDLSSMAHRAAAGSFDAAKSMPSVVRPSS
jgi:hypothetical protein